MRICAVTMVYRDHWALGQWYSHYARHLGAENLYVVAHGPDPEIARICPGANVLTVPRADLEDFDLRRGRMLNAFQAGLGEVYDWVIRTDADELICLDPARYGGFSALFGGRRARALFALGLNLAELPEDAPLGDGMAALAHRRRALFSSHYSKAWAVRRPVGFRLHGVELRRRAVGRFAFDMPSGVYLVHLKFANSEALERSNEHRFTVAAQRGKGMPGGAWRDPGGRALQFYERLEDLPVVPWEAAERKAYDLLSADPVRDARRGIVRARHFEAAEATTLPDWFRDA